VIPTRATDDSFAAKTKLVAELYKRGPPKKKKNF